ncbi:hypothetical protein P4493_04275 [Bacillus thuringiensis]|nr:MULTISPECIES: hypothetical protein [Bacillus]MEC2535493.1 hypothetical protein [Bacillus cereus]MED1153793.1 hypothetical protein [Bacillus paranthracis]AFQ30105.1 hypothetical protein BTF1_30022 [Bacillus thuringiensis HD-789]AJG73792.1 hypothetical protein BF38_5907 [Bacillus thuringiensis]AJH02878.1 hypothetical protein AS86_6450 [Bacillus thuringiensis HD1002]
MSKVVESKRVSIMEAMDMASKNNMWRGDLLMINDGEVVDQTLVVIHALPYGEETKYVVTMQRDLKELFAVNNRDMEVKQPLDQVIYTIEQFTEQFTGNESDDFELQELIVE